MTMEEFEYSIDRLDDTDAIPLELLLLADPSKNSIEDYLSRGICYIYRTDKIVGTYILIKTRPNTMEIVNISVKEDMQGKGIGKRLLLHAISVSKEEGAMTLEIGTGNSSLQQLSLYQKCGFRIVGVDKDFFIRHYDEEIIENGIICRDMIRLSIDL
ncbi:GNAT family N-acetyltransferase [Tissierella sp. MB52-C2]|uniref:GNAT family N-acetyltransferase n=1 Tax=Tissierella sp. MB52-C2 TaxID=3070999 RepID=UPI00280C0F0C|nr:GNAT family N-acetyltransferase [Tissierella sp. MB52-C2]WMM23921.1 GNAT family N-acetyltransferase [Tissierella sp. MB52-C2]